MVTVVLSTALAGCELAPTSGPSAPVATLTVAPPPDPAVSPYTGSGSPSTSPLPDDYFCPFLTQAEVGAAVGAPIRHAKACSYWFAHGTGFIVVINETFASPAQARTCVAGYEDGRKLRVRPITDLGSRPRAASLFNPVAHSNAALLTQGARYLGVVIDWGGHRRHPQAAVTLLREAYGNFSGGSAALVPSHC